MKKVLILGIMCCLFTSVVIAEVKNNEDCGCNLKDMQKQNNEIINDTSNKNNDIVSSMSKDLDKFDESIQGEKNRIEKDITTQTNKNKLKNDKKRIKSFNRSKNQQNQRPLNKIND